MMNIIIMFNVLLEKDTRDVVYLRCHRHAAAQQSEMGV